MEHPSGSYLVPGVWLPPWCHNVMTSHLWSHEKYHCVLVWIYEAIVDNCNPLDFLVSWLHKCDGSSFLSTVELVELLKYKQCKRLRTVYWWRILLILTYTLPLHGARLPIANMFLPWEKEKSSWEDAHVARYPTLSHLKIIYGAFNSPRKLTLVAHSSARKLY